MYTPIILQPYGGQGNIAIQVQVSQPQAAIFSSEWFPTLTNTVSAIAVISGTGGSSNYNGGQCVVALGNTATGNNAPDAIQLQGNPTINVPGCGVFSNSDDCSHGAVSIALGGNATINAASVGAAGCISVGGHSSINLGAGGTATPGDQSITLPPGPTLPSSGSCATTPAPVNGTVTLSPGTYCAGINANGVNFTLTSGVYILNCGATCPTAQGTSSMLIVKNASLTETPDALGNTGVTLVFTCSSCTNASQWPSDGMMVLANGSVSLTPLTTGTTAGYVMMGGTNMPLGTVFDTHSNPNVSLDGTVYMPNGAFAWGGTPTTAGSPNCLQMIVNTITLYGNSNFGGTGCSLLGSGGSGQIRKPIGSVVTLVD